TPEADAPRRTTSRARRAAGTGGPSRGGADRGTATSGFMLLSSVVEEGNKMVFDRLDESYFSEEEQPAYRFLKEHLTRHGRLPHMETIREEGFDLPGRVRETADYYLNRAISRAVYNAVQFRWNDLGAA